MRECTCTHRKGERTMQSAKQQLGYKNRCAPLGISCTIYILLFPLAIACSGEIYSNRTEVSG